MSYLDGQMTTIGNTPQYFFDNALIEYVQDLTRVVHSPEKLPEPVIKKDRPWEDITYFTSNTWNVLKDTITGEFKAWYEDWHIDPLLLVSAKREDLIRTRKDFARCCFARSHDGIHWEKPELDYLVEDGRQTNVVYGSPEFGTVHAATVIEDPLEADPRKRFKMLFRHSNVVCCEAACIRLATSPDGIVWNLVEEVPQFGWVPQRNCQLNDALILDVDTQARIYRLMTRHIYQSYTPFDTKRQALEESSFFPPYFPHHDMQRSKRRISESISSDLLHWSPMQRVLAADDWDDNLDDSFYAMAHMKMGDMYVGFLNILHQVSNTMDVRLAYSRDGWRWSFLNQRQPWLRPTPGNWDWGMVTICNKPLTIGEQVYVYYSGAGNRHDWWIIGPRHNMDVPEAKDKRLVNYALGLAKLRKDGYVSLDAGEARDGLLVTNTLHTEGKRLSFNAACREGGSIRIEVTDVQNNVLPGYSKQECDPFTDDSTNHTATWNGKADIDHQIHLKLRFFIRKASIYSFKFD